MCKYRYGKGRCAHPRNFTIECVGEDGCNYVDVPDADIIKDMIMVGDPGLENSESEDQCPNTKCGIYCKKYGRLYCAGIDNCQTEEDYLNHMNMDGCSN